MNKSIVGRENQRISKGLLYKNKSMKKETDQSESTKSPIQEEKEIQKECTEHDEQIPLKHPHGETGELDKQIPREHPHGFDTTVALENTHPVKRKRRRI